MIVIRTAIGAGLGSVIYLGISTGDWLAAALGVAVFTLNLVGMFDRSPA